MKIGVLQASTRADLNNLLFETTKKVAQGHEVVNLGVFPDETVNYSYVEVALMISLLIETGSLDFVITGCSSGQGMMLACNSLPGLTCGFLQTPQDAYLFGRINNGNVASLSLGLNFGWAAELNLGYIIAKLFDGEFGIGYPLQDASRKRKEATLLGELNKLTKRTFQDILPHLETELLKKVLSRQMLYDYIQSNGSNKELLEKLAQIKIAIGS